MDLSRFLESLWQCIMLYINILLYIYICIFVRLYTGIEREIPDSKFPNESYLSAWRFNSFLPLTFHHGSAWLLRCFLKIFSSQLSNI